MNNLEQNKTRDIFWMGVAFGSIVGVILLSIILVLLHQL